MRQQDDTILTKRPGQTVVATVANQHCVAIGSAAPEPPRGDEIEARPGLPGLHEIVILNAPRATNAAVAPRATAGVIAIEGPMRYNGSTLGATVAVLSLSSASTIDAAFRDRDMR